MASPAPAPNGESPAHTSRPWLDSGNTLFVALAFVHALLLCFCASIPVVAVGLWWNANTISHNFIHRPFFRPRPLNAAFSAFLSLLLGLPQRLWRDRHLAHHGRSSWRVRWSVQLIFESVLVLACWGTLTILVPHFILKIYLPGFLLGLALCQLQGHFEHSRGTTSHYGRLYNLLFFNDGYHVEHHRHPAECWHRLPDHTRPDVPTSPWPAVLRWLDDCTLDGLERIVLKSRCLQQFMLQHHERAFRRLLPGFDKASRVGIVGGGLFPRTALILRRLLPNAVVTIVEADADHLRTARRFLNGDVRYLHHFFAPGGSHEFDLLVIPLAFDGDRDAVYRYPPASLVLVHDWIWRPRGTSAIVAWSLLKRLNLVKR